MPRNAARVLRRVIYPDYSNERQELQHKACPVHVLPVAIPSIDGISSHDGADDDNYVDEAVREANADVPELVRHELGHGAHGHLAETGAEASESEASGEVRRGTGSGGDYEPYAADGVAEDEDDSSTEEIAVGAGEDEAD